MSRHYDIHCLRINPWKLNDVSEILSSLQTWFLWGVRALQGSICGVFPEGFECLASVGYNWIYSIPCWHEKKVKTSWWRQDMKPEWALSHAYMHSIPACCRQLPWLVDLDKNQKKQPAFPGPREPDVCSCEQSILTTLLMSSMTMIDAQTGQNKTEQSEGEVGVAAI